MFSDEKFTEGVSIAINEGKISSSLLQRKLYIGYGKAVNYLDAMEALGIIGAAQCGSPRSVLITSSQWEKMLQNHK